MSFSHIQQLCGRIALFSFCFLSFLFVPSVVSAGSLSYVSDLISDSAPGATSTTHTVTFTVENAVPAGGSIVITPVANGASAFTIPAALDVASVDVAVATSSGGPFTDRSLAAAADATHDGIQVVSGSAGRVTVTLSSAADIATGTIVQIEIGDNATYEAPGDQFIVSPPSFGSYRIRIMTKNSANTALDSGTAMIAIVAPVTVGPVGTKTASPPLRTNGLPSGLLPGGTTNVLISLNTDVPAVCKYATTSGIGFFTMSSSTIFATANSLTLQYKAVPVVDNDLYHYYVRCMNEGFVYNPDDYLIQFEVGVVPSATSSPAPPPSGSSGPSGGGGGGGLFLNGGDVTLSGEGIPLGTLAISKDGVVIKEDQISVLGSFAETFTDLERGTYNWGVSVRDQSGKTSSTYTSTIYLIGGTNNMITPIYLSPTIHAASTTVDLDSAITLDGYAIALAPVQVLMNKQGDTLSGKIVVATTTANGNGSWKLTLSTLGLAKGTYEVKAQSLIGTKDQSNFSPTLYVGIGESPNPDFSNRSDLNKDKKVNLVDFSILLFNWKTSDSVADINQDGIVNLTDFSIMLANWTG